MPTRDIIVIGASAGGVEALQTVVAGLPRDLPAVVFLVLHLYPRSESLMPEILSRSGPLPASHPVDGERFQHGRIYVAPPDRHLIVERDYVQVGTGPKEQHQRPSINVTFRSAALAYGARTVGVVLTGQLDDGTAGLWEIKRRGGVAIVQNPEEAVFPSMPLSAIKDVEVDHLTRLAGLAALLVQVTGEETSAVKGGIEDRETKRNVTDLTCPDCRGTLWELPMGRSVEYRCRMGHIFSPKVLLAEHFAAQERLLYSAVVSLEEGASLAARIAGMLGPELETRLAGEAKQRGEQAALLRRILADRRTLHLE